MYNMYAHQLCTRVLLCMRVCVCVCVIDVQESKCPQVALKVVAAAAAAADIVATAAQFTLEERSLIKIVEWLPHPFDIPGPTQTPASIRIQTLTLR